jgi:hypothetical protein
VLCRAQTQVPSALTRILRGERIDRNGGAGAGAAGGERKHDASGGGAGSDTDDGFGDFEPPDEEDYNKALTGLACPASSVLLDR